VSAFWNRIPQAWSTLRGKSVQFDENFLEYFNQVRVWSGQSVTLEKAIQVSTAIACGRVIAEGIAMMPWKIMQRMDKSIQPARDHSLYDKLTRKPNELQSDFEFKEQAGMHLAFCGNAYVYTPTIRGRVDELYLFEPGWVTVRYQWPNPPTYLVQMPNGKQVELSSAEVWHIKGPSFCTYTGLEFTRIARQALGLSMSIEEGQARVHGQDGVQMPGFLAVEGTLTEEQHKKLTKWLKEEHSGPQNAGKWGVLDRSAAFVHTTMKNTDAQTLEMRRFQVEEVCRFMRVLPIMVGHADKTATYASAEQMFLAHATYTLGPWATRVESSIGRWLLNDADAKAGYYANLDEKVLLRMTARDQAEVLARYAGGPIMTRNEARAKIEMNPLPGLDEPLTAVNTVAGDPPRADNNATREREE
jgi:HK97 family phage portal protein